MAYMRELKVDCNLCHKMPAKYEIFNQFNSSYGKYCTSCAKKRMKALNVDEVTRDKALGNLQGGAYGKG